MNPQGLADELNGLLATETRSLARHMDEATPFVTPQNYRAWNEIKHYGELSAEHARRISGLINSMQLPPGTRPYPIEVAHYHYVGLDFMLPKLVEEKKQQIEAYERALAHGYDVPQVQAELSELLAQNREQLGQLEALMKAGAAQRN